MKAKLIVEGREFPIEINHPELEKLLKPQKTTGYERVDKGNIYFYSCSDGSVEHTSDYRDTASQDDYDAADYYSDKTIAENNARADKLMRQLRRFAALQRDDNLDWNNEKQVKHCIGYNYYNADLHVYNVCNTKHPFNVYFHSESCAYAAIDLFHDELIWYFTEYKDSL